MFQRWWSVLGRSRVGLCKLMFSGFEQLCSAQKSSKIRCHTHFASSIRRKILGPGALTDTFGLRERSKVWSFSSKLPKDPRLRLDLVEMGPSNFEP